MTAVAAPAAVRTIPNILVPLDDGVSLAATLYLPEGPGPFPTLVSLNPYRKDDIAGAFSDAWCSYFARRGYAHLLVDTRGTGGSSGVCNDTLHPQEAVDGAATVEWAAAQDWCGGAVGVWGMSYGGALALGIAAQRPQHLKAIATVYGYSDYYLDSAYPGGCPNCLGKFARESWMLALDLAPPTHQDPAGRWLEVWRERLGRLDKDGIYSMGWRDHPDRDEYWQARAIDVEAIAVPTFVVGAWRDLFPEGMVRVYERLTVPKKLLMGPWLHVSPDMSSVEPIDWLGALARWWDQWLCGSESDVDAEPPVTIFVQGAAQWKCEREWPIARTQVETYFLGAGGGLEQGAGETGSDDHVADPRVGVSAGLWDPLGVGAGYPLDQGPDDLSSLSYTSGVLADDVEITGSPIAIVFVSLIDCDDANLVAKLVDVAPDGHASLISTGWLRAAHRSSHTTPERLEPDRPYEFTIQLWATSYLVRRSHRIRVTLSCSDFPRIWPTPENPRIRLHCGNGLASRVSLPTVAPGGETVADPPRPPANGETSNSWDIDGGADWQVNDDLLNGTRSVLLGGHQELRVPQGGRFAVEHSARASVPQARPDGARIEARSSIQMETSAGERIDVRTTSLFFRNRMTCSGEVLVDGRDFYRRTWRNF